MGTCVVGGQLGSIYVTVPPVMEGAPHWAATLDLGGRSSTTPTSTPARHEITGSAGQCWAGSQLKLSCQIAFGQARTRHASDQSIAALDMVVWDWQP